MKEKDTNVFSLTVLGLILASAGIIAPIAWDWWNSSSALTLDYLQETVLVEKKDNLAELEVTYKGSKVDNLSKFVFRLENTGRIPITEEDLISAPTLKLKDGAILKSTIEETNPSNLKSVIKTVENSVVVSFRLLNANDSITFSVLTDSIYPSYIASARIKNISHLDVVRNTNRISLTEKVNWTVWVVGLFSIAFILMGLSWLMEIPKKKKLLKSLKNGETPIHKNESVPTVKNYISSNISFLTGIRRESVEKALPDDEEKLLSEKQAQELLTTIKKGVEDEPSFSGAMFAFAISSLGIWYIFNSIFR